MFVLTTQRLITWCRFIAPVFALLFSISLFSPNSIQAQPAGFSDDVYLANWNGVVGFEFDDLGRLFVWEKNGKVWVVINGVKQTNPVLDISDEVGNWRDFGLVGFALDPNFLSNGHMYLQYTVDRHHLMNFGTGNYNPNTNEYFSATIGRVSRFTATASSNFTIVDESTRKVLLGESKETGVPSLHESHGIGHLVFGEDGTLMVATGDGASYSSVDQGSASETYYQQALNDGIIPPNQNVGAYRSQMLSSLDGKLLRLDPETGDGIPSNPYYQAGNPRSAQSRVWSRGLRNPYRFCKKPNTGSHFPEDGNPGEFYIGDVGWGNREELNVVDGPALNFGWPKFEGMTNQPGYNNSNYNPVPHERPVADWRNGNARAIQNGTIYNIGSSQVPGQSFVGNASTGGIWYTGDDFPEEYKNTYFHADYGADWIRNFNMDANHNVLGVNEFKENAGPVVFVGTHPEEGSIYYVRYPNQIRKISYSDVSNQAPVARASANMLYGPGPMTVEFAGSNSYDPEGQNLTYAWNFGNGATSSDVNPSFTFPGNNGNPQGYLVTLTVSDPEGKTDQTTLNVAVNNTPPVINSTTIDNITSFDPNQNINLNLNTNVTDAEHSVNVLDFKWEIFIRHDNHFHAEPSIDTKAASTQLSPIGCDGATYWYQIRLTVTDPEGLSASCEKNIYPDCPGADQTITFDPVTNKVTTDNPFMPAASASSGLPVQMVIFDGPAYLANGNVNLTGELGVVTLIAIQSGNGSYAPAPPVIRSFEVLPAGATTASCSNLGSIVMEKWTGITGVETELIPVNSTPNSTLNLNIFEIPVNADDNYGVRARGYICPPQTGNYRFWISSDDNGKLFVSSDASEANKALVANVPGWSASREWTKFPQQQSADVYLVSGNKYYIEALAKEQVGADNLAVGWTLPNGTLERPIPGNRISPWDGGTTPISTLVVEKGIAENVGSGWKTINLSKSFNSMVVATTVLMPDGSSLPAVARVRNANASSFEVKVQNPSGQNLSGYKVHYLVVEEGSYTVPDHGIKMEAFKYASPLTSNSGAWSTENLTQSNSYTSPVVLGQVQSYNDPDWSTFWAANQSSNSTAPSNNNIGAGKHVGSDADKLRASETIGVVILEAGSGTLDGDNYVAALGAKTVAGFEGGSGYNYSVSGIPLPGTVVGSISSMAGVDGGWAVLYGNGAVSPGQITWAIDEDQIGDAERVHATEHVSYIVFNDGVFVPLQDQTITFPAIADMLTTDGPFQLNASASSGLAVTYTVVSGPASVTGNTLTLNGTAGSVTVRASQAGNGSYNPAPNVNRTFTVSTPSLQDQTITFPAIADMLTTDGPFQLNALASSGLAVTYTVISGPASVTGNTLTLNGTAGSVTVRASQAGNGSYNPAPNVNRTFTISEPNQGGEYCASTSAQPWTEWITQVTFANIDNTSSKCGSTCGYSDFTNLVADVNKGTSYNLTTSPGVSWPGYQPDLFWSVWIDFNSDGDFADAGEQVVQLNNGNQGASQLINIPTTAATGITRMRVSMQRGAFAGPCESFDFGEVEDYGVNIQGGTTGCTNVASAGAISGDETHCGTSFDPAVVASSSNASGGAGSINYRWQQSTSSATGPWTTLTASQVTYNPGVINQTSWYRRQAKSSTCTTWLSSNVVVKIVDPNCPNPGEYCNSTSAQPWSEWITQVSFSNIDNSSSKCGSTCGYSDFTNIIASVNKGTNYDLTVTPGLSWAGHQPDLFWHVWIDFNGDGDFTDAGEQVLESNNGNQGATASVTIPTGAATGIFRMRVSMKRGAYSDPCESFLQGEVEDYGIDIQGATTGCTNITSAGSISGDENHCGTSFDPAVIASSANATGGAGSIQYRWQIATASSTGPWTNISAAQNSYNPGVINQTSWYRRQAKSSSCTDWFSSNVVVKIVDPNCPQPGEYCESTSAAPWTEWIANVAFANIDNSSAKCGSSCGYSDYTNIIASVNKGVSYDLTVSSGLSWPGHQPDLFWKVWIDFNGDGDFMDAGEQVLESNNGNQGAIASVSIPTTASEGTFRIRVSMKRDAYSTPCENFAQGEVEDYSINIGNGPSSMLILDGERTEEAVSLRWVTSEEENNSHFELERSSDGVEFQPLYQVDSEYDLPGAFEYTKVDDAPLPGRNFYRVKEYMEDGSFRLSAFVTVYYAPRENDVLIFPNPAVDVLKMSTPYYAGKSGFIIITNNLGQVVHRQEVEVIPITPITIYLDKFQNGLHTVSMKIGQQKMLSGQFIVAKGY